METERENLPYLATCEGPNAIGIRSGHPMRPDRTFLDELARAMQPGTEGVPYDVWGMYRNHSIRTQLAEHLAQPFADSGISMVIGAEARGFMLGVMVAHVLGAGFVPARKIPAHLFGTVSSTVADPDWQGKNVHFGIQDHAITEGSRVLLVDDWYTTGNQGRAIASIVNSLGGEVAGASVVVEDSDIGDQWNLGRFNALLHWSDDEGTFFPSPYCK